METISLERRGDVLMATISHPSSALKPALVLFLRPLLTWTPHDDDGPMDIGRLDASVYPAVQNFCVAARSLGLGTALTTGLSASALMQSALPTPP